MKTYDYYSKKGQEWIERNIEGLCGNCEMIREPKYDDHSDAYICGDYVLHINHSASDTIESLDEDGSVIESWFLE